VPVPVFAGIVALNDQGDGSMLASWAAATGQLNYEIHVKADLDFVGTELDDLTFLASAAPAPDTHQLVANTYLGGRLLTGTTYYVVVRAVNATGTDGNIVSAHTTITHPFTAPVTAPTAFTTYRKVSGVDVVGGTTVSWTALSNLFGNIQERTQSGTVTGTPFGRFDLQVTHSIYTQTFPSLNEGDRVSWVKESATVYGLVKTVVDQAGLGRWWRINVEICRP